MLKAVLGAYGLVLKAVFKPMWMSPDMPDEENTSTANFNIGDRVKISLLGIERGYANNLVGTVVGYSRDRKYARIRRDGIQLPQAYAPEYWELAPPTLTASPPGEKGGKV